MNYIYMINEGKQVGKLYHFTTFANILKILSSDTLKKGTSNSKGVSLTRDKSFSNVKRYGLSYGNEHGKYNPIGICIVIAGDLLSNRYKIQPYHYWGDKEPAMYDTKDISQDEKEEVVLANEITNLRDYVIEIQVMKQRYPLGVDAQTLSTQINGFGFLGQSEWVDYNFANYIKLLKDESPVPIKIV